ncbi:PQQ-binding-like beta-propeller repeat protein [Lapillicoccus sp.]|uniref:outer membrane protein assembly factor BamB family protein n=1 Tax=Lapillicoccus sp. TaxID=1909287 RepID=UPI003265D4ED
MRKVSATAYRKKPGLAVIWFMIMGTLCLSTVVPANAVGLQDWTGYLSGSTHTSYNPNDTTVTPSNVGQLAQKWHWRGDAATMTGQPGPSLFSSPTVADGAVYLGSNNGYFYRLDLATGAVLNKVFIGYRPKLTCLARGFIATATVAADPSTGADTVYIAAPDGYLYALDAANLTVKWRSVVDLPSSTVSDYFQWSSPTVANGRIYVGSASHCDKPLTRGAVVGYDQSSGAEFARFYTVPAGLLGGGVWTSVAVDSDGSVYASTGTQPKNTLNRYDSVSIVKLDGATLTKLGSYTVPDAELGGDGDFGGSPTIFGQFVGACSKNGMYYALDRATMSLAWKVRIGAKSSSASPAQCSAAAAYDGTYLYMVGDPTTINGVAYRGSVRRIDPLTGAFLWETGLPNSVLSSPTVNGAGMVAVGTYDFTATPNAVYLVDAKTGQIIRTLNTGGNTFAQTVFADGYLFTANIGKNLQVYHLP